MAETRSRFMDSAERLDGVVRALKTRQIEERQGQVVFSSSRMSADSPDELWAKQFATQCIGPVCFKVAPGSEMSLPPLTQAMQAMAPVRESSYTAPKAAAAPVAEAPVAASSKSVRPEPMGAAIGKPVRRGLFARMLRG